MSEYRLGDLVYELKINSHFKSKFIILFVRVSYLIYRSNTIIKFFLYPVIILYRLIVDFIMGIELSYKTEVGAGFRIYHGVSLVVNTNTVIGVNCILRHAVTIGNTINSDESKSQCPTIGDSVEIGAGAIILGGIDVGDNVKVGAALVTKNIPNNSTDIKFNEIL